MNGAVREFAAGQDIAGELQERAENPSVVVLIWDGTVSSELEEESVNGTAEQIGSLEVPLILAVTEGVSVPEDKVSAASICFMNDDATIGRRGSEMTASKALAEGFVNGVAAGSEKILDMARSCAESISRGAPLAVKAALGSVRAGEGLRLEEGLELELDAFCDLFSTKDMKEGTRAFIEKRAPVFRGE